MYARASKACSPLCQAVGSQIIGIWLTILHAVNDSFGFQQKQCHAEVANQLSGSGFPKITNFAAHRSQILTIGLQLLCDISLLKTKKIIWLMGSPQDAVKFNTLRSNCCCQKHKLIEIIVFSPNQCCKYKTTKNQRSRCASNYKKTKLF